MKSKAIFIIGTALAILGLYQFIQTPSTPTKITVDKTTEQLVSGPLVKDAGQASQDFARENLPTEFKQVTPEEHAQPSDFGTLSAEDEEKLRLNDFEGYLHYKSRIKGVRDSELLGLSPTDREETIRANVNDRIREKLAEKAIATSK